MVNKDFILGFGAGKAAGGGGGGGGGGSAADVTFYDYDGTVVTSYSAADFANLTEMPANPTHTGLTAQGWNWSLADAKAYVADYGMLNIGQMYITSDGKTRLHIKLEDGRLTPYLNLGVNGTCDIDWGDSSTHDTLTGTSTTTAASVQHTYAVAGEYTIVLDPGQGYIGFVKWGVLSYAGASNSEINKTYRRAVCGAELGGGITEIVESAFSGCTRTYITSPHGVLSIGGSAFVGVFSNVVIIPDTVTSIGNSVFSGATIRDTVCFTNSTTSFGNSLFANSRLGGVLTLPPGVTDLSTYFFNCSALSSVTIPSGVTSIGGNAFSNCSALSSVTIPSGVTSIGGSAFAYCSALPSVTIPSSVTSIGGSVFVACYALGFIKFESTTPPAVENSAAFSSLPTDCIIYVPAGHLADYTGATNYPSSSTYTYVEE